MTTRVGNMLRTAIRKVIRAAGFQISRLPANDLAMYQRLYNAEALMTRRFYNIGAGAFSHPYWTNVDFKSDWYGAHQTQFIPYDLMALAPLPSLVRDAELIYTSHTVEHVSDAAVMNLFSEAFKVLKPGGVIRITGPDADLDYAALMRGDSDYFYYGEWRYERPGTYEHILHAPATSVPLAERWLHHMATQLAPNSVSESPIKLPANEILKVLNSRSMEDALDYFTSLCSFMPDRPGNHISWWNKAKVMRFLRKAGFTAVYPCGYGQSRTAAMRNTGLFDNTHPPESFYVEAVKT